MATKITTKTRPVAEYQEWTNSGLNYGDIIGVSDSLGGRPAQSVTIQSAGGDTTLRFNVVKQIYKEHGPLHNSWVNLGMGGSRSSPLLVGEIEETTPTITISAGSIQFWSQQEIRINDIKLLMIPSGLRITVT